MQFEILDTYAIYRRLLAQADADARASMFRAELVEPFAGLVKVFGGGDGLAQFAQWGMSPALFDEGRRAATAAVLDTLAQHDAWGQAVQALEDARAAFAPFANGIPLDTIVFALLIGDLSGMPLDRGYTGFGGLPGYIMTVYTEPNAYNLPRLKGTTVHELHHNVRFTLFPFNPIGTTVGEYIIAEGLAESFAAELYGEDVVGFYVTDFAEGELATAKRVIGGALDVTGFNEVRGYIFGDVLAEHMGLPKAGVPNYAGYAIGYRVVQAYLKRTSKTVAETTFLPAREIIADSGFFAA
jgi:uncharacterized protein YjaZ